MNNNNNDNFTSLVGVKWSRSTLLKALEQNYTYHFQKVIQLEDTDPKDKNYTIDQLLKVFLPIYNAVLEYGVTVKQDRNGNDI